MNASVPREYRDNLNRGIVSPIMLHDCIANVEMLIKECEADKSMNPFARSSRINRLTNRLRRFYKRSPLAGVDYVVKKRVIRKRYEDVLNGYAASQSIDAEDYRKLGTAEDEYPEFIEQIKEEKVEYYRFEYGDIVILHVPKDVLWLDTTGVRYTEIRPDEVGTDDEYYVLPESFINRVYTALS